MYVSSCIGWTSIRHRRPRSRSPANSPASLERLAGQTLGPRTSELKDKGQAAASLHARWIGSLTRSTATRPVATTNHASAGQIQP